MIDHDAIQFFGHIPEAQARAYGDKIGLQTDQGTLTYGQLAERVRKTITALAAEGVKEGDRVAWLGANSQWWFEAFFATLGLRACFAPINLRLAAPEIAYILTDSEAEILLTTETEFALAEAAVAAMDKSIRIVTIGFDQPGYKRLAIDGSSPGQPLPQRAEDDILQLYTSGTTGLPKGVRIINDNYAGFLKHSGYVDGFDYDASETLAIVMPLFHVAGLNVSLAGLAHGCRVIVETGFEAKRILDIIQTQRVAQIFLAPTLIRMLLEADSDKTADFSSLRTVGYGASPITEALLREAQQRMGCQFTQYYGMTESCGAGTALRPGDHRPELLRSCGTPWPGMEARIAHPDGTVAEPHEVGEIQLKGQMVCPGYWKRPKDTAELLTDGWLRTGDAGYMDENGYFYVHDRIKDMIVSGGENVYPAEVENAISGCPGVSDVAVIGVPSEKWGEEVKAVIVRHPGADLQADAVLKFTRERIAGFKVPKSVDFVDELPRNPSGKVLRRHLRDQYWQKSERNV